MSAYDWVDETHSDVDDFIAAVRGEPTEAQLKALGIYSTRRTARRVERRLADDLRATAKPLPNQRKRLRLRLFYGLLWLADRAAYLLAVSLAVAALGLLWLWNRNVIVFAGAFVLLWLAVAAMWQR